MPPTLSYPGVYIQELPSPVHAITGVATSIAAFWAFLLGVCIIASGLTFLETVARRITLAIKLELDPNARPL